MTKASRWWCVSVLAVGALMFALAGSNVAQEKKGKKEDKRAHDAAALNHSLRDVINTGAKMFNEQGDHAGCYRLYQGSLLSVRPFLPSHLQKQIDDGIKQCDSMASFSDRAFALRRVLDTIRASTTEMGERKDDMKDKKGEDKGKKKGEPAGEVAGTVTFDGKPIPAGYIVAFTKGGEKFKTAVTDKGAFQLKTAIPVGTYRITVQPNPDGKGPAIPPQFLSPERSSLMIRVEAGKQQVNLNLVK